MAGELDFTVGLDTDQLRYDIARVQNQFKQIGDNAVHEGQRIDSTFKRIGQGLAVYFSAQQLGSFAGAIVRTRGEFQQLEVAFETMLGSKEKADKLMMQVTEFAAKTPFELTDVASGTKQLMAVGVQANEVIPTLKALGDVSAGLSVPIERLILNYGQVKTQGKLMGQEMRDFMVAGVPLVAELAKNLGKSKTEIGEMVSAGRIGFKDVEKAFGSMTSGAGRFANLMDKQSATITGRISNLQDAVDKMLNEMGQSSEGLINTVLDGVGWAIEHYQEIGKALGEIIAIYGVYKAALITLNVAKKANLAINKMIMQQAKVEIALNKALTLSEATRAAKSKLLSRALIQQQLAQLKANAAAMMNPYALVAAAVAALTYGIYKLVTAQTDAEKAQQLLNETAQKSEQAFLKERLEIDQMFGALKAAKKGTEAYDKAKGNIMSKYGKYLKSLGDEKTALNDVAKAYSLIVKEAQKASKARAMAQFMDKQNDALAKNQADQRKKLLELLEKKYGKGAKSQEYFFKLVPVLEEGKEFPKELEKIKKEFNWSYTVFTGNTLQDLIDKSKELKNLNDQMLQEGQAMFGDVDELNLMQVSKQLEAKRAELLSIQKKKDLTQADINKHQELLLEVRKLKAEYEKLQNKGNSVAKDSPFLNIKEDVAKLIKKLKEAKKQLENIRKGVIKYKDEEIRAKDISSKKAEIKDLEKKIESLTGASTNKVSNNKSKKEKSKKELEEELKKLDKELQDFHKQISEKNQQNEIHLMNEELNKWNKQTFENYNKKKEEINKQEKDLLELKKEIAKKNFIKKGGKEKNFNPKTVQLSESEKKSFEKARNLAEKQYQKELKANKKKEEQRLKDKRAKLEQYLKEFETYQQKKQRIEDKYDKKIEELKEGNTDGQYDSNIALAEQKKKEELDAIAKELANHKDSFLKFANSLTNMSLNKLRTLLKVTQKQLENSNIGEKERDVLQQKIILLEKQIANKESKGENEWTDALKTMNELNELAENTINSFEGLDDTTKEMLTSLVNMTNGVVGLGQSLNAVQIAFKKTGDAASFMEKSSAILMAINAGMKIVNVVSGIMKGNAEVEKKHQQALKDITDRKIAAQYEYNKLLREQRWLMEDHKSIFGTNTLGMAAETNNKLSETNKEFEELIVGSDAYKQKLEEINKFSSLTPGFKNYGDLMKKSLEKEYNKGDFGLRDIQIKTGSHTKRTGFLGWKKEQVDEYESILDLYPDLLNEEGKLNIERAKSLLQTADLTEADKERLEKFVENAEAEKQVIEELNNYLENTYGKLGDDIMDAVVNSVEKGTDAMEDFGKSAANVLKNLAKQMVYSLYFAEEFEQLEQQIKDIHQNSSDEEEIADQMNSLISGFYQNIGDNIENATNLYSELEEGINNNFGIANEEEEQRDKNLKKGIESISQDSADELNGRFTAIQSIVYEINESVRRIAEKNDVNNDVNNDVSNINTDSISELEYLINFDSLVNSSAIALEGAVVNIDMDRLIGIEDQLINLNKQISIQKTPKNTKILNELSRVKEQLNELTTHAKSTSFKVGMIQDKGIKMK